MVMKAYMPFLEVVSKARSSRFNQFVVLLILLVIVADILLGVTEDLVVIPVCSLVFDLVLGGLYVVVSVWFEVSGKLVCVGTCTGDRVSPCS